MDDDPGWKWDGSKEITLATVMLVLIVIVTILAIWNYLTLKRRREEAAVRREVLLVARRAEAKEARGKKKQAIQEALVHGTASECECSRGSIRRTFSTVTLVTENMSVLSCDIENQNSFESQESNIDEVGGQMCPVCFEEYVAGDTVSWSRHQHCKHAFHRNCIEGWLKQLDREGYCPICRGPYLNKSTKDLEVTESAIETTTQTDVESQQLPTDTDTEGQQIIVGNDPASEPTIVEQTNNECNKNTDTDEKNYQIVAIQAPSKESPLKSEASYSSFCIVHGLLR